MRRRMTALAAVLALVVASLGASSAMAQTTGADQYGQEETSSIRGVVTEVGQGSIRVDENPSGTPCIDGKEVILELTEGTEIFLLRGGTVPATAEDLRVGQTVEATYAVPEGPVPEICPQTFDAQQIVIFPEDGQTPPPEEPGPGNGDDQYPDPGNGDDQYPTPGGGSDQGSMPPDSSGNVSGNADSGSGDSAGAVSVLPDTGGVALGTLGAGALLVGLGLLARRITR